MLALQPIKTTKELYLEGKFDGLIGIEKQSIDPEYLRGYYDGLIEFLGW